MPRVGIDPGEDCNPQGVCEGVCGGAGADGYDDSISILLAASPDDRLLSADLPETFVAESFPGGAIDHIAVMGPRATAFAPATVPDSTGTSFFGLDHRPVLTVAMLDENRRITREDQIRELVEEIRQRLDRLGQLSRD